MKPTTPKLHLVDVSEPLLVFSGIVARCEKVIQQGRMEIGVSSNVLSERPTEQEFFPAGTCRACLKIGPIIPEGAKLYYTVGLVDIREEIACESWKEAS
jgi:hypothetical protein